MIDDPLNNRLDEIVGHLQTLARGILHLNSRITSMTIAADVLTFAKTLEAKVDTAIVEVETVVSNHLGVTGIVAELEAVLTSLDAKFDKLAAINAPAVAAPVSDAAPVPVEPTA